MHSLALWAGPAAHRGLRRAQNRSRQNPGLALLSFSQGRSRAPCRPCLVLSRGVTLNAMMIKATDIRRGMVITMDGVNFVVVDFAHHTPGNLRAMVQTKLRNMNSGSLIDKRLRSVDQIEVPYVETKEYEYLYSSGDEHVFMDTETYDQLSFSPEILGTAMQYLLPNSKVMVMYVADKPVSIEVPASIDLTVTDTPALDQGGDGDQPVQGSDPGDRPEGPGPPVRRPRREDPDRHPDRRVRRAGQVSPTATRDASHEGPPRGPAERPIHVRNDTSTGSATWGRCSCALKSWCWPIPARMNSRRSSSSSSPSSGTTQRRVGLPRPSHRGRNGPAHQRPAARGQPGLAGHPGDDGIGPVDAAPGRLRGRVAAPYPLE